MGFGCDAWIQSLSQLFGGLATLAAVLLSLRDSERSRNEDARRRLKALADEFRAMSQHLGAVETFLTGLKTHTQSIPSAQFYHLVEVAAAAAGKVDLVTYNAVAVEVARMEPERSKLITMATLKARSIPGILKAVCEGKTAQLPAEMDDQIDHLCDMCRKGQDEFSKAVTAIEDYLRCWSTRGSSKLANESIPA